MYNGLVNWHIFCHHYQFLDILLVSQRCVFLHHMNSIYVWLYFCHKHVYFDYIFHLSSAHITDKYFSALEK